MIEKSELSNVVCLLVDGQMEIVKKKDLLDYYKKNEVMYVLVPMQDGYQYMCVEYVPKRFYEISFDFVMHCQSVYDVNYMYCDAAEDDAYDTPLHHYKIHCKDYVEFLRFIQSMFLMFSIHDNMDFSHDNPLFRDEFLVKDATYKYVDKHGIVHEERLKTPEGNVTTFMSLGEFNSSLLKLVLKDIKGVKQKHSHELDKIEALGDLVTNHDLCFILNTKHRTWSVIDTSERGYKIRDTLKRMKKWDRLFQITMFSYTGVPLPKEDIILIMKTMASTPYQFMLFDDTCASEYYQLMLDGGVTFAELADEMNLSDILEDELFASILLIGSMNSTYLFWAQFAIMLLDYKRIGDIILICADGFFGSHSNQTRVVFQFTSEIRARNNAQTIDNKRTFYNTIMGDEYTLSGFADNLYDTFMNELHQIYDLDELPERHILMNPERYYNEPYALPY